MMATFNRKSRQQVFHALAEKIFPSLDEVALRDIFLNMNYPADMISASREKQMDIVAEEIEYEYNGVLNWYLAKVYEQEFGRKVEVCGEVENLLPCPCCGAKSLTELYDTKAGTGYDICRNCRWEDDGTSDVDRRSSVNRGSMREYLQRLAKNTDDSLRDRWLFDT